MSEFKIGEIVVFKSHPYIDKHTNIKIAAYSDYTSPILVIKQIKEKSHDKFTGKDIAQELNCYYYSSRDGKFTERWISSNLVKKIFFSVLDHKILNDIDLKKDLENSDKELSARNYENLLKASYLNKMVVLKSVDVELGKKKVNRTKDNGELVETNHLEFLPPIMTIIGYKYTDEKHKFCEKTGLPLIEFKCKWYNSNSKTFSELLFPYNVLYTVKEIQDLFLHKDLLSDINESIEKNIIYNLHINKSFELEGDKEIKITKTIGYPVAIVHKHYFYQMNYVDHITQNKFTITIDQDFDKKFENEVFGTKYPNYQRGYKVKVSDCKFNIGSYYSIVYKDTFGNVTRRIVKILDLLIYIKNLDAFIDSYDLSTWNYDKNYNLLNFSYANNLVTISSDNTTIPFNRLPKSIFSDDNVEMILKTNCLLRRGRYRNFNINRILEVTEIIEGQEIFQE